MATPFAHAQLICSVSSVPPLVFGAYNPLAFVDATAQTQIEVRCAGSGTRTARVQLSSGDRAGAARAMRRATDELRYGLYLDGARTVPWGDGMEGTSVVQWTATGGASVSLPVYGRIPARQNIPIGMYTDTVTVRIDW